MSCVGRPVHRPSKPARDGLTGRAYGDRFGHRADEVRVVTVMRQQAVLVFRQAEEPGFLDSPLDRGTLRREFRSIRPFGQQDTTTVILHDVIQEVCLLGD